MKIRLALVLLKPATGLLLFAALNSQPSTCLAQGTAFTYQGRLTDGANPASGQYDLRFTMYDLATAGTIVAGPLTNSSTSVSNGLFTVALDFGPGVFNGNARWLEIQVRTNGGGAFTPLSARLALTPAPHAIFAGTAGAVSSGAISNAQIATGQVVKGLNGLRDNVTLAAGTNVSLVTNGNTLSVSASGSGVFSLIGSNAYYTNGNVGIGRLPTTNRLEVSGDVSLNGFLKLGGNRTVINGFDGASNHWFGSSPDSDLAFGINRKGTNNYDFSFNGNLSYANLTKLDVADNFVATVRAGELQLGYSGRRGTPGRALVDLGNELHLNYDADWPTTILGGNVTVRSNLSYQMLTKLDVADNFVATVRAGDFLFGHPTRRGAPGRALVDSVDRLDVNFNADWPKMNLGGKVGIGTGDPQTALHVNGTVTATQFNGSGAGLTDIPGSSVNATTFNTTFWRTAGNAGTTPGTHFIGTTDNQPLEIKVNGGRALRLEPTTADEFHTGIVNVVGGSFANVVGPGIVAATIAGGGASYYYGYTTLSNRVDADFSSVGGGGGNTIQTGAYNSTIGGGFVNTIQTYANNSTIGGGDENTIQTNAYWSTIGGGIQNKIQTNAKDSTIGGGQQNTIQPNAYDSTIGGGVVNTIQTNANGSTIGGGIGNTIQSNASFSTIGGGFLNAIQTNAYYSAIGGGEGNVIQINAPFSTIGGGFLNRIQSNAISSTIAGGYQNTNSGDYAAVGGGYQNTIQTNAGYSTIAGGLRNTIQTNANYSTICGGAGNTIHINDSTICGGEGNTIQTGGFASTIGGGNGHTIENGAYLSTIGGGFGNTIGTNAYHSTIGGGVNNMIQFFAIGSTIAGGFRNTIQTNANHSTIGGGRDNTIAAYASFATIPGGYSNTVVGSYSFAAGTQAKANHTGAFVWADSNPSDFASSVANEVSFRCAGGVRFTSDSGGANQIVSWVPGNGSWSFTSDRTTKTNLQPVDTRAVLERVSQLSLHEWNYAGYPQRHVGPMAQDFHQAFPWSGDDRTLNSADLDGVALAAIQGLNQKLEGRTHTLEAENAELKQKNSSLEKRLDALEQLLLKQKPN